MPRVLYNQDHLPKLSSDLKDELIYTKSLINRKVAQILIWSLFKVMRKHFKSNFSHYITEEPQLTKTREEGLL